MNHTAWMGVLFVAAVFTAAGVAAWALTRLANHLPALDAGFDAVGAYRDEAA